MGRPPLAPLPPDPAPGAWPVPMTGEGPPGTCIDMARRIITDHADATDCDQCRDLPPAGGVRVHWCPSAEWAMWVLISDRAVPAGMRHSVTIVARRVLLAHWPRTVDGCRPCGLPDCSRAQLAGTWLEVVGDPYVPGRRSAVEILLSGAVPSPEDVRRIVDGE